MKTVLVTGAAGFIGTAVVKQLLEDTDNFVHGLAFSRHENLAKHPRLKWHEVDLLDQPQIDAILSAVKPTHLLHLAWYVEHGKFWSAPENLAWLSASLHLVKQFAAAGGKRAVFAGTCYEYDLSLPGKLSEYTTPLRPSTLYGATKASLFLLLSVLVKDLGVSFGWGRVFLLFGPEENKHRLIPYVINSLLRGETAQCSQGHQIRDFAGVDFVAAAFVKFLSSEVEGAVNIASGEGTTVRKLVEMSGEILDATDRLIFGAIEPPPGDPPSIVADAGRLFSEVGFARKIDIQSELEKTIDWWKERVDPQMIGPA